MVVIIISESLWASFRTDSKNKPCVGRVLDYAAHNDAVILVSRVFADFFNITILYVVA